MILKKFINEKAVSKSQRNLLGWAYACETGKSDNCPSSIKKIGKSFTKKNKKRGLKELRKFAKTKHTNLPTKVNENKVYTFTEYVKEELYIDNMRDTDQDNIMDYLTNLKNRNINELLNELIKTHNQKDKKEIIENILLELDPKIKEEQFQWIKNELYNYFQINKIKN